MAALKMLVVGGGSAGVRHFRYLTEAGVACSVCDPAARCRVTEEFQDVEHLADFNSIDLARFDGVVICTPPYMHVPQAISAAQAGCHILLEKPISVLNEEGLDELEAIVERKNLTAAVSFPYANMPAMDRIRQLVEIGEIGDILFATMHHGQNLLKYRPDFYSIYYYDDLQGGGCLQDDAMHPMMGLELLLGPEREITCQRHRFGVEDEKETADNTAWMWILYDNDVRASIDFSLKCHWRHNEWIISGSKGAIRFLVDEPSVEIIDASTEKTRLEKFDDSWNETFRRNDINFTAAVRCEAQVKCNLKMARVNLRAVLAARKSAETGEPVRL